MPRPSIYMTIATALMSTLFEVYHGDDLKCFALVKAVYPNAVFHILIMSQDRSNASDLTYHTIIEHFFSLDYQALSLGVGANQGISAYKQKWTTGKGIPGLYEIYWEKDGATDIKDDLWFSRFLLNLN